MSDTILQGIEGDKRLGLRDSIGIDYSFVVFLLNLWIGDVGRKCGGWIVHLD